MAISTQFLSLKRLLAFLLCMISLSAFSQEICNNGIDDDADGLIDLNDTVDCFCSPGNAAAVPSMISNPSFETMSQCPYYFSQIAFATGWNMGTQGTSDFQNTCGISFVFPAATNAGLLPFPDGNGISGALYGSDYKEYISTCLSTALTPGVPYQLNFNVASTPILSAGSVCNGGVPYYSPVDITIYGNTNCSAQPILTPGFACPTAIDPTWVVLGSVTYTPMPSWSVATITFTPTTNIKSIMLGPPCNLPPDYPVLIGFNFAACQPYFYYDNMILNRSSTFDYVGITPTGHYCSNNIVLTANANNTVTPAATWQWYLNGVAIGGATSPTYSVPAGNTGDYQVRLLDGSLCAISQKYTVTNAAPFIAVNSPTICASTSATLQAAAPPGSSYSWSTGATTNSIVVSPTTLSTYTVSATLGSCTVQATATVAINANTVSVLGNTLICAGQSTTLTLSNGLYHNWSDGGSGSSLNNFFTQSVTATPSVTTTYTAIATTGASGYYCVGWAVTTVSVITSFSANATASNTLICAGSSVTLTASAPGTANYSWNDGGSSSLSSYTSPTVIASPQSTTTYTLNAALGSSGGCTASSVITISVVPVPALSLSPGSFVICAGASATLTANATGASTYSWSSGQTGNVIVVSPTTPTVYTVSASNGICSAQATGSVDIEAAPVISVNPAEICVGQSATLTATGADSYTWLGTGASSGTLIVSPGTTSTYTLTGESSLGCAAQPLIATVVVIDVTADFREAPVLASYPLNSTVELTNSSVGALSYTWRLCDGSVLNATNTAVTLKDTGICCIRLLASRASCYDSISRCIHVIGESQIVIPNVFTPNNDGVNDVFKIRSSGLRALSCAIFDRWGLKMYEWNTPEGFWDGKTKSGTAPDGTYFYILHYTDSGNTSHIDKGFLTLLKD